MTEWKERCYATHCGCCFLNLCLRDEPRDVPLSYSSLEKEIWTEESSSDTREWVVFRCQARFPRCEEVRETQSRQKFRPVTNKTSPRSRVRAQAKTYRNTNTHTYRNTHTNKPWVWFPSCLQGRQGYMRQYLIPKLRKLSKKWSVDLCNHVLLV